jgi:hypothetical protein
MIKLGSNIPNSGALFSLKRYLKVFCILTRYIGLRTYSALVVYIIFRPLFSFLDWS